MIPAEELSQNIEARRKLPHKLRVHECRAREYRERFGLTLNAVAKRIGMSPAGLSAIERGAEVQLSSMKKLATFYGVSIHVIWPESSQSKSLA